MTKLRKRTLAIGLAVVLALVVCVAPAYAFFTAVVSASGQQEVSLGYSAVIDEEVDGAKKTIVMANTGDSEVMVRAQIFCTTPEGVSISISGDGWSGPAYSASADAIVWTYNTPIPSGANSAPLYITATGGSDSDVAQAFDVVVVGQESPVAYDEAGNPHAYLWDKVQ